VVHYDETWCPFFVRSIASEFEKKKTGGVLVIVSAPYFLGPMPNALFVFKNNRNQVYARAPAEHYFLPHLADGIIALHHRNLAS
jgi:hypothetical protein